MPFRSPGERGRDYLHGADIDIARAVADLGFWITDTHESLGFLSDLRTYNTTAPHPVSLWGIDAQNTTHPVKLLLAHAGALAIGLDVQAVLKLLVKRGQAVRDLSPAQRSSVDALLARLATPHGATKRDLQIAVAARSLAIQLDYWTGDMETSGQHRSPLMRSTAPAPPPAEGNAGALRGSTAPAAHRGSTCSPPLQRRPARRQRSSRARATLPWSRYARIAASR